MPGGFLIDELQMDITEVAAFKRKLCFGRNGGKKKGKVEHKEDGHEYLFEDNSDSDSPHGSPEYAESQDKNSASSDNEGGMMWRERNMMVVRHLSPMEMVKVKVLVAVEFVVVQVLGLGKQFTSVQGQLERRNQLLRESKICKSI